MAKISGCMCELCDESFETRKQLLEHQRVSHRTESFFSGLGILPSGFVAAGLALILLVSGACSQNRTSSRDVEEQVQESLEAAGLRDVTADQDTDKGVVTLTGDVPSEAEKMRAEQVAKSSAGTLVIANEIAVRPPGFETEAKSAQSATDAAIEENFKAKIILEQQNTGVDYSAEEGVLTLTGEVDTEARRTKLEQLAATIPNVKQVVNKLEIEGRNTTTGTTTNPKY